MNFPLSVSDVSLWLPVVALIILITSELLYASPSYASKIDLDKRLLRLFGVGCGVAFILTVLMRVGGMS
jgi:hypothetical protein